MKIGKILKEIRKDKKLNQEEMIKLLGNMSIHTYRKYEQNKREPSLEMINKIANALGMTIDELVGLNRIGLKVELTFKEAFSQFITDKRYLLDVKSYNSIDEYNEYLENLYNATIEYIEFYCFKLK